MYGAFAFAGGFYAESSPIYAVTPPPPTPPSQANNVLDQSGIGSTDWTGGYAPPTVAAQHSGISTLTMQDGTTFTVWHSVAETRRKMDTHAIAHTSPQWVAFDLVNSARTIVLNVGNVISVH